jgi:hypothetical protein
MYRPNLIYAIAENSMPGTTYLGLDGGGSVDGDEELGDLGVDNEGDAEALLLVEPPHLAGGAVAVAVAVRPSPKSKSHAHPARG